MKRLLLLIMITPFFVQAQILNWGTHTTVNTAADGYGRPRIVLTVNDSPFIIWTKESTPKSIKAVKWNGTAFSAVYDIVGADLAPTGFIGPEIAAKGDTVYIIFESQLHNNHVIYLKRSFDGGLTFSDTIRVSDDSDSHKFAMPNVAVREDGNPLISYMECLPSWTDWKQVVKTSFNFGMSFSAATDVSALAPGEPCDCCQSTMVTNGNNVYLLFRNDVNNVRNSYIAKSDDDGQTFTVTQDLDDMNWVLSSCPTSSPVGVVNSDSIMVVRRSGASGVNELYVSNVHKDNLQKSYYQTIDPIGFGLQDNPEVVAAGNIVAVVWKDNRNNNTDCFLSYSTNGVAVLSGSVSLTDSTTFGHKKNPDIAYADGTFHMVYTATSQHAIVYVHASIGGSTAINELSDKDQQHIAVYDALGKSTQLKRNTPLFYQYPNGSVKQKIVVE